MGSGTNPSNRVVIRDLGPFEEAEIEIKPLTIFIGRNSSGKSYLLYTLWTLTSTMPDFKRFFEVIEELGALSIAESIVRDVAEGRKESLCNNIRKLMEIAIDALPHSLSPALEKKLRGVFLTELENIVRRGASSAMITAEGPRAAMEFTISKDRLIGRNIRVDNEFIEKLNVDIPRSHLLRINTAMGWTLEEEIVSVGDVAGMTAKLLGRYVSSALAPFFFPEHSSILLPDSRAGITRTLLKPYLSPEVVESISHVDSYFVRLYFRLAEKLGRGDIDLELLKPILKELGCRNVRAVYEAGAYTVYVDMWNGVSLPVVRTPSGIRETLAVALALTSPDIPLVFLEEPESHLHPRAQLVLAKLISSSINSLGKNVILTTHSDNFVAAINNLIMASKLSREKLEKLQLREWETLRPDDVAAYLIRMDEERGTARLERLKVTEEGIPEDELASVAEELAYQRALLR